jgi:hypothetical protein
VDEDVFRSLAKATADELSKAFDCFYPLEGNHDLPEALIATYFAYQLRGEDYYVYPQIQVSGLCSNHLDFAAINLRRKVVLLGEAKQLCNPGKACELSRDWRRLQGAKISGPQRELPSDYRYFGCLMATTWKRSIQRWWTTPQRAARPDNARSDEWQHLRDVLSGATVALSEHVKCPARLVFDLALSLLFALIPL